MDGFTIRPNTGIARFTSRERSPTRPIATELDAAQSVTAVDDGNEHREQRHDHMPHDVVIDPEAREVINRENDVRAQETERAHPDQALLRYRAYQHPVQVDPDHSAAADALPHANIKA